MAANVLLAKPTGLICAAYCEMPWRNLRLRRDDAQTFEEPGLGASLRWMFKLSTGRQMMICYRELQPEFSEIWLEYSDHFELADLEAAGEAIEVRASDLVRVGGQLKWRGD